jgi:hypothetical protein
MSNKIKGKQIEDKTITNQQISISITPSAATDAVSKSYLEAYVMSGLTSGTTTIGPPRDGTWDGNDGLLAFTTTTPTGYAINDINQVLAKLTPALPPNLSTRTLSIASMYTAAAETTGTVITSQVIDNTQPVATVSGPFADGDAGILTSYVDGVLADTVTLTTANDAGVYGSITIGADEDPYVGQTGKAGFYHQLNGVTVQSQTTLPASTTQHSYGLHDSTSGNVPDLIFYVDNPGATTVSSTSFMLSGSTSRYISGVPSLASGQAITVNFTVNNAVSRFYNATRVATTSGSFTSSVNSQPVTPPAYGAAIPFINQSVTVNNGVFGVVSFNITPYNSKNVAGTASLVNTNAYVDTVSNETLRKTSSTGQYPTTGYGTAYDSTKNIKIDAGYTEELQLANALFQFPTLSYDTYAAPTTGPNYSSGMATASGYRWVTIDAGIISNKSTIDFTFQNPANFTGGAITTGILIYLKCEGVTDWIDGNAAYSASIPSPSANGDPAMVFANSTTTVKRITFGATPRSGQLYLRVGLPTGSSIKFSNVTYSVIN